MKLGEHEHTIIMSIPSKNLVKMRSLAHKNETYVCSEKRYLLGKNWQMHISLL